MVAINLRTLQRGATAYIRNVYADPTTYHPLITEQGFTKQEEVGEGALEVRRHPGSGKLEVRMPKGGKAFLVPHPAFGERLIEAILLLPGGHRVKGEIPPAWRIKY